MSLFKIMFTSSNRRVCVLCTDYIQKICVQALSDGRDWCGRRTPEVCVPAVLVWTLLPASPPGPCPAALGGCMSSMGLEEPAWFSGSGQRETYPASLPSTYLTSSVPLGKAARFGARRLLSTCTSMKCK